MSIRKKFIIFSVLWGIIPAIIATIICISNFNAKNIEMIKQNVATLANDQSVHLKSFFNQNIIELSTNSNMPMVKDFLISLNNDGNAENQQYKLKLLNEILINERREKFYLSAELLINKGGNIIAASDNEYFNEKAALSGEEYEMLEHGKVVVTNIIERNDFNKGVKSAIIARPIFLGDKYLGAIASVINMSYFEKLVNEIHFFETQKMVIMDRNGVIASSSSDDAKNNISEIDVSSDLYEKWKAIDFNLNPDGLIEYNLKGIEKIAYYSRIGDTGWAVISGVEWTELKTPINESIKAIVIFLILILLILVTSYAFTINQLSKPIYGLLEVIRKIRQGDYKDRFVYDENNEFGEIAAAFNDLIDTIENNKKHIEDKNRNLQSLTSNIPGGVYRCRIENEEFFIDFISSGYLNILGYKKNQFKEVFNRNLAEFIHQKDIERVTKEIGEQLRRDNKYSIEYRIKRKDGEVIWLMDSGQLVKNREGKLSCYSVVINITEAKQIQEELRLSEERYGIIMSQTDDIIFEWNIKKDTIYFSDNWKKKFNYEPTTIDISKNIYNTLNIHKDDIKNLGKIINSLIYGDIYTETEIRIRKNKDKYIWCKIRITAMFDDDGNIFKAIGVIIDIDKEKKEAERLLYKAQRDSLTGLYNKGTLQSLIEEYIESEEEKPNGALFVIDLDNFKGVNDNLGHLAGDLVLTTISSMISDVFYENSIVGRIGGDEFVIFLKDAASDELIHKKAEELVNGFRTSSIKELSEYKVSGSIGIAKYPEHGSCYKELFICADKAAYLAKNRGKDNYCIFMNN